ncbi:hypothetical protein ACFP3J_36690 [Streptomyces nogalater]|uniref:Uncharacterized protein n=1 Tax=Streptomyces nogalater TaxID=38314 RepID=A0ABW0WTM0_STRNO
MDITETGTLRPVLDDTITGFGRLDVVVNNAGYALAGPFESDLAGSLGPKAPSPSCPPARSARVALGTARPQGRPA